MKRWALVLLVMTCPAHAARPLVTDDARLVDAKACQVESWARRNADGSELWALPACNPAGNVELTLGGGRLTQAGERSRALVMQAKTLLRPLEPDGWGIGFAIGNVRTSGVDAPYAYVPVSLSLKGDARVVHLNFGWTRDAETRRDRMTWGVGTEWQVAARSWLVAETYGQNAGKPFYQVGVRHWLVPNRVQVDFTTGDRWGSGSGESWVSIGLRLLSPPFLP